MKSWNGKLTRVEAIRILDCATDKDDPFCEHAAEELYDEKTDTMRSLKDTLVALEVTEVEYKEAQGGDNVDWSAYS